MSQFYISLLYVVHLKGALNSGEAQLPSNSVACDNADARLIGISSWSYQSDLIFATMRLNSSWLGPFVLPQLEMEKAFVR